MTAPYHLIAFWEGDKKKDLPAIGSRMETTIGHNYMALIFPHPEKPLSVLVESHVTLERESLRGFFGKLESKDLDPELLQQYKKIGLFQLAISNEASQDPMIPPPPPLICSRGMHINHPEMRVYCTTPTADYDRFKEACRTAPNAAAAADPLIADSFCKREFVDGREKWQPIDYAHEWYRELKALHGVSGPDKRLSPDPQVLNVDFIDLFFILLGDERNQEDSSRDVVTVVVQMPQDQRKDPIRTFRCTADYVSLGIAGSVGLGDWSGWHEQLEEVDGVLEC